ncbi:MAG: Crp/Fnr family transcriptional regulator [Myxococcota bacterium]
MNSTSKTEALAHSTLGAELNTEERALLVERMGSQTIGEGETLVKEGETRRTLFMLASGSIDVCKMSPKGEQAVHQMQPGECAGTRAFIDGSARKATLRSRTTSEVLTLEPDDFEALLETQPRIVYKVMRAIFRITHANLMRMNQETHQLQDYFLRTGDRH